MPVGAVIPYAGAQAPANWLLCDGSSLLRATYPSLFAVLGTTFGSVDGSHFTLPDLRGAFPMGKRQVDALGATGGSFDHTHTSAAHVHAFTQPSAHSDHASHTHSYTGVIAHTHTIQAQGSVTGATGGTHLMTSSATGGSSRAMTAPEQANSIGSASQTTASESAALSHSVHVGGAVQSATPGVTGTNNPPYVALNYIVRAA